MYKLSGSPQYLPSTSSYPPLAVPVMFAQSCPKGQSPATAAERALRVACGASAVRSTNMSGSAPSVHRGVGVYNESLPVANCAAMSGCSRRGACVSRYRAMRAVVGCLTACGIPEQRYLQHVPPPYAPLLTTVLSSHDPLTGLGHVHTRCVASQMSTCSSSTSAWRRCVAKRGLPVVFGTSVQVRGCASVIGCPGTH